jgi:hypothetical protein
MREDRKSPRTKRSLPGRALAAADALIEGLATFGHGKHVTAATLTAAASAGAYAVNYPYLAAGVVASSAAASGVVGLSKWNKNKIQKLKDESAASEAFAEEQFGILQDKFGPFQSEVLRYIDMIICQKAAPTPDHLKSAARAHTRYLEELCKTAVSIFGCVRPDIGQFDANIKYLFEMKVPGRSPRFFYAPIVRASSEHDRVLNDEELRDDPIPVRDNYVYRTLLSENYRMNYFVHPDIIELIEDFRRREKAREPDPDTTPQHYNSMVVQLIGGPRGSVLLPSDHRILCCRQMDVLALMCVDSRQKYAFVYEEGPRLAYDLALMRRLTDYAFTSFQLMFALNKWASEAGEYDQGLWMPIGLAPKGTKGL